MMCYYCHRTGNGQGMRMLSAMLMTPPSIEIAQQPKGRPPRESISEDLLQHIEVAITNGDTFVNQAKLSGFSPEALKKAWQRSGRKVRGIRKRGLPETISLDTVHEFALWCESRGHSIKKSPDKRIIWSIQVMEGGRLTYRSISNRDGKFTFSNSIGALFKTFIKERNDCRSSE